MRPCPQDSVLRVGPDGRRSRRLEWQRRTMSSVGRPPSTGWTRSKIGPGSSYLSSSPSVADPDRDTETAADQQPRRRTERRDEDSMIHWNCGSHRVRGTRAHVHDDDVRAGAPCPQLRARVRSWVRALQLVRLPVWRMALWSGRVHLGRHRPSPLESPPRAEGQRRPDVVREVAERSVRPQRGSPPDDDAQYPSGKVGSG